MQKELSHFLSLPSRITLTLFCILSLLLFLTRCSHPIKSSSKPVILVTIPPYAYFVKAIAGDLVTTEIFVPPGANPHSYEPTPHQVETFARAKIWFRFGDPIEQKILPFLEHRRIPSFNLSEAVELLPAEEHGCHQGDVHEGEDLHTWLNPSYAIKQAKTITDALCELFPESRDHFTQGYEHLAKRLRVLDQETEAQLAPFRGSYLLLSHPALGYYCARYGLQQLSIEHDGKDPLPQQVAEVVSEAQMHQIKMVLIEPQYNNKGAILIAEKLHIPTYEIDPYAWDYFGSFSYITRLIVENYGVSTSAAPFIINKVQ